MSISENIDAIRDRIASACVRSGRNAGSVRLMAVSKFHPAEAVLEAVGSGLTLFGENRVQEADSKFPDIIASHPDVELHLIGSLQRNKVAKIAGIASCIQSVDREELLVEIAKQCASLDRAIDVLFEYHTAEDSKSGYAEKAALFRSLDLLGSMPNVRCRGLMTMAPFTDDRMAVRSSFRQLVSLRR